MPDHESASSPESDRQPTIEKLPCGIKEGDSAGAAAMPEDDDVLAEGEEWEEVEVIDSSVPDEHPIDGETHVVRKVRRRRRQPKADAAELRLLGRRALCKSIGDVAPNMLKTVKLRVLGRYLQSVRGFEDDDLTKVIRKDANKLAEKSRILETLKSRDTDFDRGQLKSLVLNVILQEETYSIEENRLDQKVIDTERVLVKQARSFDLGDLKKQDPDRWHYFDTYRIVLDAAWSNDGLISEDESHLLEVLREHLGISLEDHWLISAMLKRFPKEKCALHIPEEINEARKELQREGLLWSYHDDDNRNIDIIPVEIASIIRPVLIGHELQRTNYRRLVQHDSIMLTDLRNCLVKRNLNRYGNKPELIERIVMSPIRPSEILNDLDRDKISNMCACFGLKAYGTKAELIQRLIDFYDDLTFEERVTKDEREVWYSNYELLASRAYAELRAKKIITKDLEIEHYFEGATQFLFESRLRVQCLRSNKENRADGRLPLENDQSILWDCKSVEGLVNLQDHLDTQFDGYLRKEAESGKQPLAFLVIGPAFTPQSIKLAHQYKAKTNWDVALVMAEALKHLAERWFAAEPTKPFPIRLLNSTELVTKERAEFLISLG